MSHAQIYGIKNCDTMKKAFAWLKARNVNYVFHDYRKEGIGESRLRFWCAAAGWQALVNRRGLTWRRLTDTDRESLDQAGAIRLMRENPTLIKRPVLEVDGRLEIGFSAERYAQLFPG